MAISIETHELPYDIDTHSLYDVTFFDHQIHTLVTHTPSLVDQWLADIQQKNPHGIVGFDVEWRPSFNRHIVNPVAILQLCVAHDCLIFQLCVAHDCLIFQLLHTPSVPESLSLFLSNQDYSFVGFGIESDVEKLVEDYGLSVGKVVDLRGLAAERLGLRELKNAGLKRLAMEVLGKEVQKPKRVTMSRWDYEWLTPAQVQYACLDAFLSYEIGKELNATGA